MNDEGKTVTHIDGIRPSYQSRQARRKKPAARWIQFNCRLNLNADYPGAAGYDATMRAIHEVSQRAIKALADEFLP